MTPPTPPPDFAFKRLDVYVVCRSLTVHVVRMNIADAELRDQATCAAKSVLLNLTEGLPFEQPAGARRRHSTIALGRLYELAAALDVSEALGLITAEQLASSGLAYRARGMLALSRGAERFGAFLLPPSSAGEGARGLPRADEVCVFSE